MLSNAQRNRLLLGVIVVVAVGIGAMYYLSNDDSSAPSSTPRPQPPQPQPTQVQNLTPGSTSGSSPAQLTPQPSGEVPEGKTWSAEHGHWHDAPGSTPSTSKPQLLQPQPTKIQNLTPGATSGSSPAQLTPQPSGEVPEGKTWSAEHGHWHDAPRR